MRAMPQINLGNYPLRNGCECGGYQFFWSWEIEGWRGPDHMKLCCLRCGKPFWFERLYYWWYGYTNNNQLIKAGNHDQLSGKDENRIQKPH